MEYWGKVGSYYEAAEETHDAQKETQKEVARETAEKEAIKPANKVISYQDFDTAIDNILKELSDEEKYG